MKQLDVLVLNNLGGGQAVQVKKLPLPGETVKGYNWTYNIDAGKGPNSCIAMGRLGIRPAFIGKAGQDAAGDRGENWMREAGVDTSGLLRTTEVNTGQGVRVVEEGGKNLIVTGESSSRALTVEEVREQIRRLQPAQYFLTGFEIREELTLEGAKCAKELGMTTVLNLSPIPYTDIGRLEFIDYVVINETEAESILGIPSWREHSTRWLTEQVRDKYGCGAVVLTLGSEGSCGLQGDHFWEIQPCRVETVDTSGAGDAFVSAMVVGLVRGRDIADACDWAGKFAAYTTTIRGTIPSYPDLATVEAFIQSQEQK